MRQRFQKGSVTTLTPGTKNEVVGAIVADEDSILLAGAAFAAPNEALGLHLKSYLPPSG